MPKVLLRAVLAALGVVHGVVLAESVARAQAPAEPVADPLVGARALFAEALQDEQSGRPADALEKFKQVRSVRDTASIEYRIGSCQEALGQLLAACASYQMAAALGKSGDPESLAVAGAASARVDALSRHLARLTLVTPGGLPPSTEVRLDGAALAPSSLGNPVWVEPGHHTVTAMAENAAPFQTEIALGEGAEMSLKVSLAAPRPGAASDPGAAPEGAARGGASGSTIAGGIAVAGGAALVLGSAVLLVVRASDIAKLDDACPHGQCPPGSNVSALESTRSRALVEGPLALGCGIAGVAAAAVGLYLVVAPRRAPGTPAAAYLAPFAGFGASGVSLIGEFR
jgi:hypothetical protein